MKRPSTYFSPSDAIKSSIRSDSKVFVTLDLASGYHQVELAEKDRDITTFITPFGRFRFKHLPMGLSPSGDYFNIATMNLIALLDAVHKSADDMLIEGKDKTSLVEKLIRIFQSCRENGVTLNPRKYKLGPRVKFGGFVVKAGPEGSSSPSISPDPDKINRILNCEPPRNKAEVQSFVGMIKQMNAWSIKLTSLSENLRKLATKHTHFEWN
jgi:hypothetical protein